MRGLLVISAMALAACELPIGEAESERLGAAAMQADRTGICEVHHVAMIRKTVPRTFGYVVREEQYSRAMNRHFPHAEAYVSGGCDPSIGPRTGTVYVCPQCKRAELDWARKHPGNWEAKWILEHPEA